MNYISKNMGNQINKIGDSNTIDGCSDKNYYLYEIIGVCFKLVKSPHGRVPTGKYKNGIIALSKNYVNKYPSSKRLKDPISVPDKNRSLYRFEYL